MARRYPPPRPNSPTLDGYIHEVSALAAKPDDGPKPKQPSTSEAMTKGNCIKGHPSAVISLIKAAFPGYARSFDHDTTYRIKFKKRFTDDGHYTKCKALSATELSAIHWWLQTTLFSPHASEVSPDRKRATQTTFIGMAIHLELSTGVQLGGLDDRFVWDRLQERIAGRAAGLATVVVRFPVHA